MTHHIGENVRYVGPNPKFKGKRGQVIGKGSGRWNWLVAITDEGMVNAINEDLEVSI
jgi:ribosomal protein L21E